MVKRYSTFTMNTKKYLFFASFRSNLADFIESTLVYNNDRVLYIVKELAGEGCGCSCCY